MVAEKIIFFQSYQFKLSSVILKIALAIAFCSKLKCEFKSTSYFLDKNSMQKSESGISCKDSFVSNDNLKIINDFYLLIK
jgi:hypothetical protein